MNLYQTIFNHIQELTNPNNEIRSKAEEDLNILISQNPVEAINTLFEIMNNDPSKKEAYLCAILIRNCVKPENLIPMSQNTPDFFINLKYILLKMAKDIRFPSNLNMFLISDILYKFYAAETFQGGRLFPEFIPFLISLLDNDIYRSNALEELHGTNIILKDLQNYYPQIIEKCDLFSPDIEYRTRSFCFYINCIKFNSFDFQHFFLTISNQFSQIFDDMPDKQLNYCITTIFQMYECKYNNVSVFFPLFFNLFLPRLLDNNRDELTKINFINNITSMLSSTFFFNFISQKENCNKFLELICFLASNPIQFPDLYFECGHCIKKIYIVFFIDNRAAIQNMKHIQIFYNLFKELSNSTNLFISSLISKIFIDISNLRRAIEFASIQDDPNYSKIIIRHNGLSLIKNIIKTFYSSLTVEFEIELFGILMNLYAFFEDEKIMKVLTLLSGYLPYKARILKRNEMINLCNKKITKEIICCATHYCIKPDSEDSINLSKSLFQATLNLMNHDIDTLSHVISNLSLLIDSAGLDATFEFLNQVMPVILDDPKCFTNSYLATFIEKVNVNNEFAKAIFSKIIEFIQNMSIFDLAINENIVSVCLALKKVPFYADFFEFSIDSLKSVISIIERLTNESDFRLRGRSIKCLSKLSKHYCTNPEILGDILRLFQSLIENEDNLYVIKCLNFMIYQIVTTLDEVQPDANVDQFILLYPSLFDHSYNVLVHIFDKNKNDKVIDQITINDTSDVITNLRSLINFLFSKNQQLSTKMVLDFFFTNKSDDEQDSLRYDLPLFRIYFAGLCNILLNFVNMNLYSNFLLKIVQMLINYAFNEEINDISTRISAISSLSSFFAKYEMPTELIFNFIWDGLVPLLKIHAADINNNSASLMNSAIAALIETFVKYSNKEINFQAAFQFLIENLAYLTIVNKATFQHILALATICFQSGQSYGQAAKILIAKVTELVMNGSVEKSALKIFVIQCQAKQEIPEAFTQLYQVILQVLNSTDDDE
ncbi:hypothetical protein M9Y10_028457 [Tritrichomonas musculus]|uniref:Importin N-terminal domain-containing protein n=1 Tax=Tritrichomonas musculus TaxID=1915356 RepID=A0ABR2KJD7_9EUKA